MEFNSFCIIASASATSLFSGSSIISFSELLYVATLSGVFSTSKDVKQTAKNTLEVEKTPDSVATYKNSEKEIMEESEKRDVAEAEAMIQKLLNSTPQQLGLEEEEARKRMKQKQK